MHITFRPQCRPRNQERISLSMTPTRGRLNELANMPHFDVDIGGRQRGPKG